ncbi:hypothetical protein [Flavobacterium sp.]|uniref:hypothetical protein n=1 Tax=Flavobacterium sp. TaxID=239 RepID=UPI00374CBDB1
MKILNFKVVLIGFILALLSVNCAPHCDDEDYRQDEKKAAVIKHSDSLEVKKID